MAKYLADELELQSVANAIRAKGNTSESLAFPTDFVSAIADIPAGGNIEEDGNGNLTFSTDGNVIGKMPLTVSAGGTYTPPAGKAYSVVKVDLGDSSAKAVNFRDYDGTIVNSYTKEEFLALTAMPANPSHDGLTSQGWNWSFADAQAYVAKYGRLEIGQMYITDDGKTRVYIHLEEGRTSPMLGVCPNGAVDVDWGDGTAHDTLTGTSTSTVKWTPNHVYAAPGDYVIKLTVTGSMGIHGTRVAEQGSELLRYSSSSDNRNYLYRNAIRKIEIGNNTTIEEYAFFYCYSLGSVTIPGGVTNIGSYAFSYCYSLATIIIPDGVTTLNYYTAQYNYGLVCIVIPNSITSLPTNAFNNCPRLESVIIPDRIKTLNSYWLTGCYSLASIIIPDGVTNIKAYMTMSWYAFAEIHFTSTTPPTLASEAFSDIPSDCIIYVPYSEDHSILEAYKTATNWSTYASKIQEEPV